MTYDELMALPDVTPTFGSVERIVDGQRVMVPALHGNHGALWQEDNDPIITTPDGERWMVGWIKGRRVRSRFP